MFNGKTTATTRIKKGTRMLCTYQDKKDRTTKRVLRVENIEVVKGRVMLGCWDYDKNAHRAFYQDRMKDVLAVNHD